MAAIEFPFERTEISGVPVFWRPAPGPLTAELMFRVGRADEPTALIGITRLLAHLAVSGAPTGEHATAIRVDNLNTSFVVQGTDDEVIAHLAWICHSLQHLPLEHLEVERALLEVESGSEVIGPADVLACARHGVMGIGSVILEDYGLQYATAEDLLAHSARYFHRQNAILCLTGAPLASLRLDLGDGAHVDPPPVRPLVTTLPATLEGGEGGAAVSFSLPRSPAAAAFLHIAAERLHARLQANDFLHGPEAMYVPLGIATAEAFILAPSPTDRHDEVTTLLLQTCREMAENGVDEVELASHRETAQFHWNSVEYAAQQLHAAAHDFLLEGEAYFHRDRLAALHALSQDDVTQVARKAYASMLCLTPDAKFAGDIPLLVPAIAEIDGAKYGPAPVRPGVTPSTLVVGDEGVGVHTRDGRLFSMLYEHCVLVQQFDSGAVVMLANSGVELTLDPTWWKDGRTGIASVLARLPAEIQHATAATNGHSTPGALEVEAAPNTRDRLETRAISAAFSSWSIRDRRLSSIAARGLPLAIALAIGFALGPARASSPDSYANSIEVLQLALLIPTVLGALTAIAGAALRYRVALYGAVVAAIGLALLAGTDLHVSRVTAMWEFGAAAVVGLTVAVGWRRPRNHVASE